MTNEQAIDFLEKLREMAFRFSYPEISTDYSQAIDHAISALTQPTSEAVQRAIEDLQSAENKWLISEYQNVVAIKPETADLAITALRQYRTEPVIKPYPISDVKDKFLVNGEWYCGNCCSRLGVDE